MKIPRLKTDKAVEAVRAQDLSGLDFSQFKKMRFEQALEDALMRRSRLTP
jgi:predicted DNA binding CopG/RHH family protein